MNTAFRQVAPRQRHIADARAEDDIDLREIALTLWRGKGLVVLAALTGAALGLCYLMFLAVPTYTASASVALESQQPQVVDLESVVSGLGGDQSTINTEVEVIRSRRLLTQLVDELQLTHDPEFNKGLRPASLLSVDQLRDLIGMETAPAPAVPPEIMRDSVVDAVMAQISVTNVRQSYVFRITATTEDPSKSALLANTLATLYIQDQVAVKFEKTEQATEWLSGRVTELQIALENAEAELKDYSASTDLISPEGLIALNRQLKDLRDRNTDLRQSLQVAEERLAALQGEGPTLFDADRDRAILRATTERDRTATQIAAVQQSITELTVRIEHQSDELVQLQQLQREAEANRLIYEYFLGRMKETAVQQGIQQADSRVLSHAPVPLDPTAPRRPLVLGLSTVLAAFLGAAMILLREFAQNTFRLPEELEAKTGYPILGKIPMIPTKRRKSVQAYLKTKPNSAAAEAVRNLRTSLLLGSLDRPPQIIMSTSSIPGEGKTTQSIALAQNLADMGKSVLLVEGDIRRCVFREYFDKTGPDGLLSVLTGDAALANAVIRPEGEGFDVLMGEKPTTNAADIFSSHRFVDFLDGLRKTYDHVIIDSPPVLAVTDARIIGLATDAVIYTVKWDSTTHRQVADGLKSLEQVNVNISGLVLSQISGKGMKRYGYGDSYGSYQTYYQS